ncbi:JAB domain-containing protein [Chryseobacterium gambrini]|uniref:JAB domain-containing protein n=1 Tax=Chryseobacterium gambrini TaxID=373672 RepID=A0AAJ1R1D0_9FLAO|nr:MULTISPECIES: JAB domain-containing protein [Chryseobacterium]MDN4012000.1 JAB domain-containing protein [Chryseobacterium gambrini]QWA36950.1 JAB domain-containing protein [Chryseobacterium sp. ZHDP1]
MEHHQISEIQVSYSPNIIDTIVSTSEISYKVALNNWNIDTIEMFEEVKIMFLNNALKIIGIYSLSKGGISSSIVDIRLILSVALKSVSTHIILIHNHPSTGLKPSKADMDITSKLKAACGFLDIKLLDHLIINKESYYSFADEGLL